jgi:hypothetical protein
MNDGMFDGGELHSQRAQCEKNRQVIQRHRDDVRNAWSKFTHSKMSKDKVHTSSYARCTSHTCHSSSLSPTCNHLHNTPIPQPLPSISPSPSLTSTTFNITFTSPVYRVRRVLGHGAHQSLQRRSAQAGCGRASGRGVHESQSGQSARALLLYDARPSLPPSSAATSYLLCL